MILASVKIVERMSGRDATVNGILSGLRHLRDVVVMQGGEDAGHTFDDSVREHVLSRVLAEKVKGPDLIKVTLPSSTLASSKASAIIRDVSESCLVLNSVAQDEGIFAHTVIGLLDQLIDRLGGSPDWAELQDALKMAEPSQVWEVSPIKGSVTLH
jgi:hypothetical protein